VAVSLVQGQAGRRADYDADFNPDSNQGGNTNLPALSSYISRRTLEGDPRQRTTEGAELAGMLAPTASAGEPQRRTAAFVFLAP